MGMDWATKGESKVKKRDIEIRQSLLKAFGGNTDGWTYTETVDAGPGATLSFDPPKCPCGHPIRYICKWEHQDGRKTHTGNVCVHTIPELAGTNSAQIERDIKALKEKEKEAIKAEKAAMAQKEVQVLWEECKILNDKYNRTGRGWSDVNGEYTYYTKDAYYFIIRSAMGKVRKLKTAKGKIKKLRQIKADLIEIGHNQTTDNWY